VRVHFEFVAAPAICASGLACARAGQGLR
jgi:hypothetical protein